MSGNDGWGGGSATTTDQWGAGAAPAGDKWGTTNVSEDAIAGDQPQEEEGKTPDPVTDLATSTTILQTLAVDGGEKQWVEKTAYNYQSFERDAEAAVTATWSAEAPRFEWKEEYGEVAPRDKALEEVIFGVDTFGGDPISEFAGIGNIEVTYYNVKDWSPPLYKTFSDIDLHEVVKQNIELCGYYAPTPIQRSCIPAIMKGNDIIACAQTGSGKTAAFLIPIISKLMGKAKKLAIPRTERTFGFRAEPLVLIIAPTRELATQIFLEARKFCYRSFLRPCVVYGGADIRPQRMELEKGCDVLVGTPGRLQDFVERGNISLHRLRFIVVDEADEMLDMGFEPQLRKLLHNGDANEDDDLQVLMFSATFPGSVRKLAKEFLADDYIRVAVGRIGSVNPNVIQKVIYASWDKKRQAVYDLLTTSPAARTLIFVSSKREADSLDDFLWNQGLPTTSIHGDRNQREREDALLAFRVGKCPILIATDVASRGLDIRNVLHVINYDLPKNIEEYTHRIGRTARIGSKGLATTFWNDKDGAGIAEDLVRLLIEGEQKIPHFLEPFRPAEPEFKDDVSDGGDDNNAGGGGEGGGWGGGGGDAPDAASGGGEWGGNEPAAASTGENWDNSGGGGSGW